VGDLPHTQEFADNVVNTRAKLIEDKKVRMRE